MREALEERALLLGRLCPHLVRPVPFLYPLQHARGRARVRRRAASRSTTSSRAGAACAARPLPRHRHLSRTRLPRARARPAARRARRAGIQYYDAQVDDARHTLTLARTAALHGAALATSVRAVGLRCARASAWSGARATCLETGEEIAVRARQVINATGVWTDHVQELAGARPDPRAGFEGHPPRRAARALPRPTPGSILRTEKSVLFVIPWGRHWIVGTTDTDWNLDLAHPAASRADIDYLLARVNAVLAEPLGHDDIEGVYAGLRPLLSGESEETSRLSREHAVSQTVAGLLTVAGGKYTTYRVMARDAVDAAARNLGGSVAPSCTHADAARRRGGLRRALEPARAGSPPSGISRSRTSSGCSAATARARSRCSRRRARGPSSRVRSAAPRTTSPPRSATRRRTRARSTSTTRSRAARASRSRRSTAVSACAREAAELLGEVLGWSDVDRQREVAHYEARVRAERESQQQSDDQTADAARLGAPDVRLGRAPGAGRGWAGAAGPQARREQLFPEGTSIPQAGSNGGRSWGVLSRQEGPPSAPGGAAACARSEIPDVALPRDRTVRGRACSPCAAVQPAREPARPGGRGGSGRARGARVYPEDDARGRLEASTEADLLVDDPVAAGATRSDSFRDLLEPYPQDDQEQLFDLSRYPDLVEAIAERRAEEPRRARAHRGALPGGRARRGLRQGASRHRVVVRMHALLEEFDGASTTRSTTSRRASRGLPLAARRARAARAARRARRA